MSSIETRLKKGEEKFLSEYDIARYDRPSVTTDIAVFSIRTDEIYSYRKSPDQRLSLLLIKRGEHPYLDKWALPGGFLKMDETVEECACREVEEETGILPVSLMPIGTFSRVDRDPRGRIVSNGYAAIINGNNLQVRGGSDAKDAEWFDVDFCTKGNGLYELTLHNGGIEITALLEERETKFKRTRFSVKKNQDLAFDHAEIIGTAISALRNEADDINMVLDFLPERFTLNDLQKVQEALLGKKLLTANFRRKAAEYVKETEQYTEGAGHRPARIFTRKG